MCTDLRGLGWQSARCLLMASASTAKAALHGGAAAGGERISPKGVTTMFPLPSASAATAWLGLSISQVEQRPRKLQFAPGAGESPQVSPVVMRRVHSSPGNLHRMGGMLQPPPSLRSRAKAKAAGGLSSIREFIRHFALHVLAVAVALAVVGNHEVIATALVECGARDAAAAVALHFAWLLPESDDSTRDEGEHDAALERLLGSGANSSSDAAGAGEMRPEDLFVFCLVLAVLAWCAIGWRRSLMQMAEEEYAKASATRRRAY